jgi:alpha-tubulin suppressor-like RCC1 family protein
MGLCREFRDQVIGYRYGNGKVFTWGVRNEGRLGHAHSEKEKKKMKDPLSKPFQVRFPEKVVIVKICSGNSHSLALSAESNIYTWG